MSKHSSKTEKVLSFTQRGVTVEYREEDPNEEYNANQMKQEDNKVCLLIQKVLNKRETRHGLFYEVTIITHEQHFLKAITAACQYCDKHCFI
jgi:invasion protein IalB